MHVWSVIRTYPNPRNDDYPTCMIANPTCLRTFSVFETRHTSIRKLSTTGILLPGSFTRGKWWEMHDSLSWRRQGDRRVNNTSSFLTEADDEDCVICGNIRTCSSRKWAQCLYNRHGKRTSTWCCYCLQDQSTRRQIDLEISKTKTHGRWVRVSLITMLLLVTITMNSNSRFYDTHLRQYRPKFFPRTTSFTTTKKDGTKITPRTPRCILWQHLCHVLRDECMSIDELQTIWRRNQWTCQRLRSVDSISRRMVYTTC